MITLNLVVGLAYPVDLCPEHLQFLLGKQPPSPAVTMFSFLENPFLEPAEQGGPADANRSADFNGSIIGLTVYLDRHVAP